MNHSLKPCPFCGNDPLLVENEGNENWPRRFWVECIISSCGAKSKGFFGASSYVTGKPADILNDTAKRDLVEWWNRRAGETP